MTSYKEKYDAKCWLTISGQQIMMFIFENENNLVFMRLGYLNSAL